MPGKTTDSHHPDVTPSRALVALAQIDTEDLLEDLQRVRAQLLEHRDAERRHRSARQYLETEESALRSLIAVRRASETEEPIATLLDETLDAAAANGRRTTTRVITDAELAQELSRAAGRSAATATAVRAQAEDDRRAAGRHSVQARRAEAIGATSARAVEDDLLEQLRRTFDQGRDADTGNGSSNTTTRQLILDLLHRRPEQEAWTPPEVHRELVRIAPHLTKNLVRVTLRRMRDREEVERREDGRYRLPEGAHQLAIAPGAADKAGDDEAQSMGSA